MKSIKNIFFILIVIWLSSCTNSEISTDKLEIENAIFALDESPLQKDETFGLDDNIKTASFISAGNIFNYNIEYPYFDDYEDEITVSINKAIYEAVISENFFKFKDYSENLEISYEIMYVDERIISILFSGYFNARGSYSDYEKAVTIDLYTGNILTLGDLFTYEEVKMLVNDIVKNDKGTLTDDMLNAPSSKHYLNIFLANKYGDSDIFLTDSNNFYVKKNKVGLICEPLPSMRNKLIVEIELDKTPSP